MPWSPAQPVRQWQHVPPLSQRHLAHRERESQFGRVRYEEYLGCLTKGTDDAFFLGQPGIWTS